MHESRKPRKLIVLMSIAVLCIIIVSGYKVSRIIYWGEKSIKWPSIKGTIIESFITKYNRGSHATIRYTYSINDISYTSNRVTFYDFNILGWAEKYPKGAEVIVYFDPDFPERSVLEPGANLKAALSGEFTIVIGLSAVLIFFIITGYGRKWNFPVK